MRRPRRLAGWEVMAIKAGSCGKSKTIVSKVLGHSLRRRDSPKHQPAEATKVARLHLPPPLLERLDILLMLLL